jgi:hypothetical protein
MIEFELFEILVFLTELVKFGTAFQALQLVSVVEVFEER